MIPILGWVKTKKRFTSVSRYNCLAFVMKLRIELFVLPSDVLLPVERENVYLSRCNFRRQVLVVYLYYGFLHFCYHVIIPVFIFISFTSCCIVKCN